MFFFQDLHQQAGSTFLAPVGDRKESVTARAFGMTNSTLLGGLELTARLPALRFAAWKSPNDVTNAPASDLHVDTTSVSLLGFALYERNTLVPFAKHVLSVSAGARNKSICSGVKTLSL